ncbi:MAG: FxsA family protein [Pseudoruegeria sp.]
MWLFVAFLMVPLIEIGLFIQVGGFIGLWPTLLIVLITAMLGTYLVRSQGISAMNDMRSSMSEMRDPTEPLAHGAMILFAGALLLTPGFFTDFVGFLLLFPPFRRAAFNYVRSRVSVQNFSMSGTQSYSSPNDTTIDGDFEEVREPKESDDPFVKSPTHVPSDWTKH